MKHITCVSIYRSNIYTYVSLLTNAGILLFLDKWIITSHYKLLFNLNQNLSLQTTTVLAALPGLKVQGGYQPDTMAC